MDLKEGLTKKNAEVIGNFCWDDSHNVMCQYFKCLNCSKVTCISIVVPGCTITVNGCKFCNKKINKTKKVDKNKIFINGEPFNNLVKRDELHHG